MILSSPFSRHNRSHQTWSTNGIGSPPIQANGLPSATTNSLGRNRAAMGSTHSKSSSTPSALVNGGTTHFKSQTLNRKFKSPTINRNVSSSLGHHPQSNGIVQPAKVDQNIYAPASIASPSEYRRKTIESQHYAATSLRGGGSNASESGRSGRESALGNLLERFGTLTRRRSKWAKSKLASQSQNGTLKPPREPPPPPPSLDADLPPKQVPLDPEIYATGKKKVEAEDIYAEGLRAIDSNQVKRRLEHQLDESVMFEGETKTLIDDESKRQPEFQDLINGLTHWINDELAHERILVTDLQDDLHDGQILGKLIEKLHQIKLDIVEVTQNESTQRHKLRAVLDTINKILSIQARWARIRWSVEGIHGKNLVEIIYLLVTLALYYRAPMKLPSDVRVRINVVQKYQNQLVRRSHQIQLTDARNMQHYLDPSSSGQPPTRDAFDILFEAEPNKVHLVKQTMAKFIERHLAKIGMNRFSSHSDDVLDPDRFSDGLLLVFLISSLEGYFVPLGNLFTSAPPKSALDNFEYIDADVDVDANNNNNSSTAPRTAIQPSSYINTQPVYKLHNVNVAFQLMEEAGIDIRNWRVRAEDIVNGDLKSVLRVIYALFSRYKHL